MLMVATKVSSVMDSGGNAGVLMKKEDLFMELKYKLLDQIVLQVRFMTLYLLKDFLFKEYFWANDLR